MTLQEIYTKVVAHLKRQGKQSHDGEKLRYKYKNLSCPVGYFIDNNLYDEGIEGFGISEGSHVYKRVTDSIGECDVRQRDLLLELQSYHDHVFATKDEDTQLEELERIATAYHLKGFRDV